MSRTGTGRDGLRLAFGTLTVLRVPAPLRVDRPVSGVAMTLAPVAALVPAAAAAAVCVAGQLAASPPLVTAVLAVGSLALSTRGLHLDGLADTADGLASGHDRERALRVMRTGDIGPAGVAALTLVLLAQVAAISTLLTTLGAEGSWLVGALVVVSRAMLPIACAAGIPAARGDGLGAGVAGSVPWPAAAGSAALAIALTVAAAAAADAPTATWPAADLAALGAGSLVTWRCVRRVGGVTGDVLGAVVEVALAAALCAAAIAS